MTTPCACRVEPQAVNMYAGLQEANRIVYCHLHAAAGTLQATLRDLLQVIDTLEGIEYSRDYERPDQARAHWEDVIRNADAALTASQEGAKRP